MITSRFVIFGLFVTAAIQAHADAERDCSQIASQIRVPDPADIQIMFELPPFKLSERYISNLRKVPESPSEGQISYHWARCSGRGDRLIADLAREPITVLGKLQVMVKEYANLRQELHEREVRVASAIGREDITSAAVLARNLIRACAQYYKIDAKIRVARNQAARWIIESGFMESSTCRNPIDQSDCKLTAGDLRKAAEFLERAEATQLSISDPATDFRTVTVESCKRD